MARHLIQSAATGATRIVGDSALAFFPGYVIVDTLDDGVASETFFTGGESDLRFINVSEISDPASAASVALRAAYVPFWKPSEVVTAGTVRMTALGVTIKRNSDGTTRSTYDATEAALWTAVGGGGGSVSDASSSTKGVLQLAGDLTGAAASPQVRPAYAPRQRFAGRKLTPITSFAAGHGWTRTSGTATVTDDTTATRYNGSQALKITTAGTSTTDLITSPVYTAIDLTKVKLVLRIKVDAYANLTKISLRVASGGATSLATNYAMTDLLFPTTATNQFTIDNGDYLIPISFGSGNATTNYTTAGTPPTLTAITTFALFVKDLSGQPVNVTVSGLYTQPTPATTFPKGLYVLTFDDCNASHLTLAAPYLARYGMVATEFPVIDSISATTSALSGASKLNLADLHMLEDSYGWDVGCHSDTTANHGTGFDSMSATALDDALYAMKSWGATNGFRGNDALAYPQGLANTTTRAAARKYFSAGRGTNPVMGMETFIPFDPMYLRARSISATTTLAQMQADIDYLTTFGGVVVHLIHDIQTGTPTGQPMSQTNFQALVDYAATAGVTSRTMPDWVRATQSLSV